MGKMPLGGEQRRRRGHGSAVECGVELRQLAFGEGQEKAFEKDDRFAEAGIQVVMGGVEEVPFAFGLNGGRVVQFFRSVGEGLVEVINKVEQRRDFMKKLRTLT